MFDDNTQRSHSSDYLHQSEPVLLDTTLANVMLRVDSNSREEVCRPRITLLIDRYTREVKQFSIETGGPDTRSL